jgi:hypothetical protein
MRALESLSTGLQRAPDWDRFHLQNFSENEFCSGSQYGAMTEAAERPIAQLYSQDKLRLENRTSQHENEVLTNEPAPDV